MTALYYLYNSRGRPQKSKKGSRVSSAPIFIRLPDMRPDRYSPMHLSYV